MSFPILLTDNLKIQKGGLSQKMSFKKKKQFKDNNMYSQQQKTLKNQIKCKFSTFFLLLFVTVFCLNPINVYARQVWKDGSAMKIHIYVNGALNQTVTITPHTTSDETNSDVFEASRRNLTHTINRPNPTSTSKPYISSATSNNNTKQQKDIGGSDAGLYLYGKVNISMAGLAGYTRDSWKRHTLNSKCDGFVDTQSGGTTTATVFGLHGTEYFAYNIRNGGITGYGPNQDKKATGCYINYYYIPNKYTITAQGNGGKWGNDTSKSGTVTYHAGYWIPNNPTRAGYDFVGWFTAATGGTQVTSSTTYTTAGNSTIYAHWTAKKYTITAQGNGGKWGNDTSKSGTVTYNGKYWIPNNPTRAGYSFDGWYTAASGGTKVTTDTTYTTAGNSTIYAHWKANNYTLTLDARGGKVNGKNTDTKSVTYNGTYGTLPNAVRNGYSFDGWFTSVDGSDTAVETGTSVKATDKYTTVGNQTLYAHWTLQNTITYDANGGTGDKEIFYARTNVKTTYYNGAAFSRKDTNIGTSYTLVGWSTNRFTTKVMYKPGQEFTPTSNIYLYAVWRKTGTGFIQLPRYCGDMFTNDISLKGGNGTVFNSDFIDGRRAHIDGTDPRETGEPNAYFSIRQD